MGKKKSSNCALCENIYGGRCHVTRLMVIMAYMIGRISQRFPLGNNSNSQPTNDDDDDTTTTAASFGFVCEYRVYRYSQYRHLVCLFIVTTRLPSCWIGTCPTTPPTPTTNDGARRTTRFVQSRTRRQIQKVLAWWYVALIRDLKVC